MTRNIARAPLVALPAAAVTWAAAPVIIISSPFAIISAEPSFIFLISNVGW